MNFDIAADWTLFLDRDGVLNERIVGDYVRRPSQFKWLPGVLPALAYLQTRFARTLVVTNQQGVGKSLMSQDDLDVIHSKLLQQARYAGVELDAVYACTGLAQDNPPCRKPRTGMALEAQAQFPQIDFTRSLMVGDSRTDIEFGAAIGMRTVQVGPDVKDFGADARYANLYELALALGA